MDDNVEQIPGGRRLLRLLREIVLCQPGVDNDLAERVSLLFAKAILRWLRRFEPESLNSRGAPIQQFDPFAFGIVATLMREGQAGLLDRLSQVQEVEQLHRIALSQHLFIPAELTDIAAVRRALLESAKRRLARRMQVAS